MRAFWTTAAAALMTIALARAQAPAPGATPPGPATGTCNFSPVVADLDRAVDFYEKALGMQFTAADAPTRKFDTATPLIDIHGVKGGAMRWASARPPSSRCGIELVEFAKVTRTPVQPRPQDPGATTLILIVRDIAPAFARAKQAGATIVSSGGGVVPLANGRGGAVLFKDLDGHYIELLQLPPQANAPQVDTGVQAGPADNIIGWRARVVVENSDSATTLYRDLGFTVPPLEFAQNKVFADLNGVADVPVKINNADIPGATRLELVEFKDLPHTAVHPHVQDPGATRFQVTVSDAAKVGAMINAAGGEIVSTGGTPHALPGGRGGAPLQVAVARDPNNLFLVLVQAAR